MTATTRDTEGTLPEQPVQTPDSLETAAPPVEPGVTPAPEAAPSEGGPSLLMNAPANRCRVCSAEMASDQRYCVECGTRRGKPRFTLAKDTASAAATVSAPSSSPLAAGWTRLTALLAIAVVLLALGIGVLVGNSGASISQPVKVQITGGSLSSGAAAAGASSKSGAAKSGTSTKSNKPAFSAGS
jgi:hypothetical protein